MMAVVVVVGGGGGGEQLLYISSPLCVAPLIFLFQKPMSGYCFISTKP